MPRFLRIEDGVLVNIDTLERVAPNQDGSLDLYSGANCCVGVTAEAAPAVVAFFEQFVIASIVVTATTTKTVKVATAEKADQAKPARSS